MGRFLDYYKNMMILVTWCGYIDSRTAYLIKSYVYVHLTRFQQQASFFFFSTPPATAAPNTFHPCFLSHDSRLAPILTGIHTAVQALLTHESDGPTQFCGATIFLRLCVSYIQVLLARNSCVSCGHDRRKVDEEAGEMFEYSTHIHTDDSICI